MKTSLIVLLTTAAALLIPSSLKAAPTFFWKAKALFPVQIEEPDPKNPGGTITKVVSLDSNEIINLALGQDLTTKNPDLVLAVRMNHDDPATALLCVFNPGTFTKVADVLKLLGAPVTNVKAKDPGGETKGNGNGLGFGQLFQMGNATNGLDQNPLTFAATSSLAETPDGPNFKMSVTGLIGQITGFIDGVALDGILIKGMFTASGKPL